MKTIDEPPYLTVGTDVSAKYRGAFCEAKIKTAKRLVKVKVTFRHDSSTVEVQDDHIKGPLKVGTVVEVKNPDGTYQEAVINKLTDASWYTVVFDDGDEKTLRRSSLCLKGERHFAESETLDQLPLTNPEHFGTPVIGKKTNRGRRSNHIPEEESSSSSSDEDEDDRKQTDELLGKVVCVDSYSVDKKKAVWFPALQEGLCSPSFEKLLYCIISPVKSPVTAVAIILCSHSENFLPLALCGLQCGSVAFQGECRTSCLEVGVGCFYNMKKGRIHSNECSVSEW